MEESPTPPSPVDATSEINANASEKRRSSLVEILKQERLQRISKNAGKKPTTTSTKSHVAEIDEDQFGPLPPPDYYYRTDAMNEVVGNDQKRLRYTPIGRNAVEMGSRFYVERNLFSYLANAFIPTEQNYFDDDFVDASCYTAHPKSYIILGKPGIGKATLGRKLAEKLSTVFIGPKEVLEYYQDKLPGVKVNEILEAGGTIGDKVVTQLIQARIAELDVLHVGYVMAGFPMTTSDEVSIDEQIEILETLALPPQYVLIMNMQDADLYKRRIEQKLDPETSIIYGRVHYSKFNADKNVFPSVDRNKNVPPMSVASSDVGNATDFSEVASVDLYVGPTKEKNDKIIDPDQPEDDDPMDGSRDFLPLPPNVIFRLITRTEDNPIFVNDDLELFRNKLSAMQSYVERFDKRKVLELDAYWAPSVILKRSYEFLESCCGVSNVPIPVQILPPPKNPIDDEEEEGEDFEEIYEGGRIAEACSIAGEDGILGEAAPSRTNMTWHTATRIYDTELREEDQAILEALMKWEDLDNDNNPMGIPNWARFRNKKRSSDDKDDKDSENSEDEDSDEEKSVEEEMGEDQDFGDILTSLENKPDQYNNLLKKMDGERCFGDTKYYCPVTFVEENLLRKGSPQFAAKYRYRLYYCADEVTLQKFLNNPMNYLSEGEPHSPPPPRICITGSPGCGQEAVGLQLAKQYNICYINFRQRLHELTKARLGREVGPNKTGDIVTRYESEKLISKCKSGDDIIKRKNKNTTEVMNEDGEVISEQEEEVEEDTEYDEEEEEVAKVEGQELDDDDEDDDIARKITRDSKLTLHPVLDETKSEELKINEAALRSLGLLEAADLKTVPIGSVERTERLTERKWKKLTKIETYAQAFLENGIQLPDIVLDEYVLPLFKEAPFNQVGFIMVGFPNTDEDIAYLVKRNILPEAVFVMECEQLVIRNRLLRDAVDKWHIERNPTGRKKKRLSQIHGNKILPLSKSRMRIALGTAGSGDFHQTGFEYQSEGRPVIDEYEEETWTYNDTISSMITMALKHYHTIFSKDIRTMKMSLNKNRVDWLSINTNPDLFGAKSKLEKIMSRLKNRSSMFEDTVRLTMTQANTMLNYGLYLSRFQRWCPVELFKGNTALNMWNVANIPKIPIVYRRYVYFLAGEKNANYFENNCWEIINQETPMHAVPAVVVIRGPPKSGKTTLAKKLAQRLGLVYISGPEMIEGILKHSFVSQFADILHELEPNTLAGAPQPMTLAEEILTYVRDGQTVPKFMVYRVLDLVLQQPKAQYHGIVFDDYPLIEEELQELLYRGVVPSTVIELKIDSQEAKERCKRNRNPEYDFVDLPEDGDAAMEYATMKYNTASETTLDWFQNEVQNTTQIDGTQNKEWIYQKAEAKVKDNMKQMQTYLTNVLLEKPSTLEGTCPLTSQIPDRLSPEYGFYCPVSLNEDDDLIRVTSFTNLSEVVEYKGHVYILANAKNVKKFLANPSKYLPPSGKIPPKELPTACSLTVQEFEDLKGHQGFKDFDPVMYFDADSQYKGLQRGNPKYCVAYRNKIYCFVDEDNVKEFMKKPERYWHQTLPAKLPRKSAPLQTDKVTPYCYLIDKCLLTDIKKVIRLAGEKRPRLPFVNPDKCASLFMGYHFKSQNMNTPYEIRQKYRNAMFEMMQQKNNSKKFHSDLEEHYGSRIKMIPEKLRTKLDEFMKLESLPIEEKVLVPTIPGVVLTRDGADVKFTFEEIQMRCKNIKFQLHEAEKRDKAEAFNIFFQRKRVSEMMMLDEENANEPTTITK